MKSKSRNNKNKEVEKDKFLISLIETFLNIDIHVKEWDVSAFFTQKFVTFETLILINEKALKKLLCLLKNCTT